MRRHDFIQSRECQTTQNTTLASIARVTTPRVRHKDEVPFSFHSHSRLIDETVSGI